MTPSPVEKAVNEQSLLYRRYRAAKKQEYARLFAMPIHGPLLRKFSATLGHFGIDDADRMIEYVRRSRFWIQTAPEDIRAAAKQMVGDRIVRIRQRAGLIPYDDALPEDEQQDVFSICKKLLTAGESQ